MAHLMLSSPAMECSVDRGALGCPVSPLPGGSVGRAPGPAPAPLSLLRSLLETVGVVDCGVTLATILADAGGRELVAMLLSGVCSP